MRQFLLGLSFSIVFIVGCAVGTMQGSQVASAQAPAGSWVCYAADRLDNSQDAANWRGAKKITSGLNEVAPNVPAGTIISTDHRTAGGNTAPASIICIKN